MNPYLAEFVGTTILILFGNGVVANVVLARTKGNNAGWIVITAGWGLAVFIGAFCSAPFSGAHLNPAVTTAMAMSGKLEMAKVAGYIGAQMLGGIAGAGLVFLYYREHFKASADADAKLACSLKPPDQVERGE
jgi:glycerol uptake facilitator protein